MTTSTLYGYRHDYQPGPHPLTADERRVNVPLRLRGAVAERLKGVPKRARFVEAAVVDALAVAARDARLTAVLFNTRTTAQQSV